MKTLDEVIKAVEVCNDNHIECDKCIYSEMHYIRGERLHCVESGLFPDTLHYLKEYQRLQIAFLKALADLEDNPPLTWDELKTMGGKPVWVEDVLENGEWYIIECFTDSGRFIAHDRYADDTVFKAVDMGKTWQAYRKERE